MNNLSSIVQNRFENLNQKNSRLHSQVQVEAVEVWEKVLDKKVNLGMLLGLAKRNLPVFLEAKRQLHAMYSDGMIVRNKVSYFLWLYKHINQQRKK